MSTATTYRYDATDYTAVKTGLDALTIAANDKLVSWTVGSKVFFVHVVV